MRVRWVGFGVEVVHRFLEYTVVNAWETLVGDYCVEVGFGVVFGFGRGFNWVF